MKPPKPSVLAKRTIAEGWAPARLCNLRDGTQRHLGRILQRELREVFRELLDKCRVPGKRCPTATVRRSVLPGTIQAVLPAGVRGVSFQ